MYKIEIYPLISTNGRKTYVISKKSISVNFKMYFSQVHRPGSTLRSQSKPHCSLLYAGNNQAGLTPTIKWKKQQNTYRKQIET